MNRNMTRMEAAIARAEEKLAEAREASARTDQAIDRAQEAINKFWERQEAALARMRGEEKKCEAKAADNASCKCSCRDFEIDPELLMELVADLILLAGRMDEQLQAIEKRTRPQKRARRQSRTRHSAGRFVPPAF